MWDMHSVHVILNRGSPRVYRLQGENTRSVSCALKPAWGNRSRDEVTDRIVTALRAGRSGGFLGYAAAPLRPE